LVELGLLNVNLPTSIFNDNKGAVDWSNSSSTKGMRHVNIRENAVREAIGFNEVSVLPGLLILLTCFPGSSNQTPSSVLFEVYC